MDDEDTLLEFCKRTITKDNVNRIPADWDHALLAEHRLTLDHCKQQGYGFLPLMMVVLVRGSHKYPLLTCWFVTTWRTAINLDAEYPYTKYHLRAGSNDAFCRDIMYSSLVYAISWNAPFAHFLLLLGASPSIRAFRHLVSTQTEGFSDAQRQVALFHFDRGCVPYSDALNRPWIQEKCREYQTRRAYCRRTLIKLGGILRRRCKAQESGWDRHLVQHMMRYVWATRWREEWNQ